MPGTYQALKKYLFRGFPGCPVVRTRCFYCHERKETESEVDQLCPTLCDQATQSMEFSRQEYWSGLLFPSPGDLPYPRIKPRPPALQADALPSEPPAKPMTQVQSLVRELRSHKLCHQKKKKLFKEQLINLSSPPPLFNHHVSPLYGGR